MTSLRKHAVVIVVNLVLLTVLLEGLGAAMYGINKGEIFYVRQSLNEGFVPGEKQIQVLDAIFHPFFGYVHRQNPAWATNEGMGTLPLKGGENCCDIPLIPNDDQIIVAVFGGSVARELATHARKYGHLQELIGKIPAFKGKDITILNFTMSGYRQPQQLFIFTYYVMLGQKFDIAINIDGFNEVYHGMLNAEYGLNITFPSIDIWGNMQNHIERLNMSVSNQSGIQAVYYSWASRSNRKLAEQCTFAACFLFRSIAAYYHDARYQSLVEEHGEKWEKISHFFRKSSPVKNPGGRKIEVDVKDPDQLYPAIADYWGESSRMMSEIAERRGILYLHILQPNLYYETNRKFIPKKTNDWTARYSEPVTKGYKYMVEKVRHLKNDGVLSFAPMGIFDKHPGDIYMDDCCHYLDSGNEILSEYIAKVIREHYKTGQNRQSNAPGTGQ